MPSPSLTHSGGRLGRATTNPNMQLSMGTAATRLPDVSFAEAERRSGEIINKSPRHDRSERCTARCSSDMHFHARGVACYPRQGRAVRHVPQWHRSRADRVPIGAVHYWKSKVMDVG